MRYIEVEVEVEVEVLQPPQPLNVEILWTITAKRPLSKDEIQSFCSLLNNCVLDDIVMFHVHLSTLAWLFLFHAT